MDYTIRFTKNDVADFKREYEQAVVNDQDHFKYKDQIFFVGYAKYLLEYLTKKFADKT